MFALAKHRCCRFWWNGSDTAANADGFCACTLSGAEGWETVEKDNGVVAAGAASDFESSWDEPEALMGGAAGQSSSAEPAARGSKVRPSRDRHGWRL